LGIEAGDAQRRIQEDDANGKEVEEGAESQELTLVAAAGLQQIREPRGGAERLDSGRDLHGTSSP
jgi:hypothetical protein